MVGKKNTMVPALLKRELLRGWLPRPQNCIAALHVIGFKLATNCCQFMSGDVANYTMTYLISWAIRQDKMHYIIGNCCMRLVLLLFSGKALAIWGFHSLVPVQLRWATIGISLPCPDQGFAPNGHPLTIEFFFSNVLPLFSEPPQLFSNPL